MARPVTIIGTDPQWPTLWIEGRDPVDRFNLFNALKIPVDKLPRYIQGLIYA